MPKPLVTYRPSATYEEAIRRAAELYGIEAGYYDIWGRHHTTSVEEQKAILRSLGVAVETAGRQNGPSRSASSRMGRTGRAGGGGDVGGQGSGRSRADTVARLGARLTVLYQWEDGARANRSGPSNRWRP
jgi:hypothetical protein